MCNPHLTSLVSTVCETHSLSIVDPCGIVVSFTGNKPIAEGLDGKFLNNLTGWKKWIRKSLE